ncbi:MAG: carbamate kinase [Thermoplasmataceae archaeon]
MERIVIAFGGNALLRKGDNGDFETQSARAYEAFSSLGSTLAEYEVVISHGNGPQVGNILLQNEFSRNVTQPMPLYSCGAMSQGLIGLALSFAYEKAKYEFGLSRDISVLMTRTLVDNNDPSFTNPSKPIGPFYTEDEAAKNMKEKKWFMKEDSGRGWRRLVPSPVPIEILERKQILSLLSNGFLPVCSGGGGIPVVKSNGFYEGVDAVIDKDLASSVLASSINARRLVILTDVENAFLAYGKPEQEAIGIVNLDKITTYSESGVFARGSMGPKITAAIRFIRSGGKEAIITSLDNAKAALAGKTGTIIRP